MKSSLIERYSDALVEAIDESKIFDERFSDVTSLARMISFSHENIELLEEADSIPGASIQIGNALIEKLDLPPILQRLVIILAKRHRLHLLPDVIQEASVKMKEIRNIIEASVTSARALEDDEKAAIQKRLDKITHHKADIEWILDTSIIGGISIKIGDRIIDGSVKARMEKLRKHLLKPQGAH